MPRYTCVACCDQRVVLDRQLTRRTEFTTAAGLPAIMSVTEVSVCRYGRRGARNRALRAVTATKGVAEPGGGGL
ncbi:hypothetical protein [Actinomadura sp. 9N407]|uniref:hypothetical protein n=1 Tax=Actinomadura sp. 9N407 TaxID=3375154 RepID=UPI0037A3CE7D